MIPKLIHLLWINRDGKPIPANCAAFVSKWKALHPEFAIKVWGLEDVQSLNDDMFEKIWADTDTDEAAVCNLIRMVIVHKFGGVYADIDTEPLKSFEPLLDCPNLGVGGYGTRGKFELNLFFANPGDPVLAHGIAFYKKANPDLYKFGGRTPLIMDELDRVYPNGITKYPEAYFQDRKITPDAFSTHWTHPLCSWHPSVMKRYMSLRAVRRPLAVDQKP